MNAQTAAKAIEIVNRLKELQDTLDYLLRKQRDDKEISIILRNWYGGKNPMETELMTLKGAKLGAMINFFIQEINKTKAELEAL